ncbi:MAG: hypothetical protein B5M51_00575 [Anaerolinea sp. 4484_236]|nr:MAG: hypothetical protein B5M51_00575 [Anaerolinea sp. 4484_236]
MNTKNNIQQKPPPQRGKAQGMLEFALVLPILLLLIFGILEYGRLFYAWIVIENAARSGVRYASTGNFNSVYCVDGSDPGGQACDGEGKIAEIDDARIPSIRDEAETILFGNPIDSTASESQPGYFKTTVCSGSAGVVFTRPEMGGTQYSQCTPGEHPGAPGDRVIVSVDYNFPFVVPFFEDAQSYFHLASYREGIVEQFRVSRIVNIPPTIMVPTVPTNTPMPTFTASATATPGPTDTPTATPTPDCDLIFVNNIWFNTKDDFFVKVRNNNPIDVPLTNSVLTWPQDPANAYINLYKWAGTKYYNGNSFDSPHSQACSGTGCSFPSHKTKTWQVDFNNIVQPISGHHEVLLTFGGICDVPAVLVPTATPTPSQTPTITPTPDCDDISAYNLRIGSSSNHADDDNVMMNVTNDNPVPVFLTYTSFTWTNPYGEGIDWFEFGTTRYYSGNSYSSPTTYRAGNTVEIPAGATYRWNADFTSWKYPIYGNFRVDLVFDEVCPVSDTLFVGSPTPSLTPTITLTATNTPLPSPTMTPTPTADCNLISSSNTHINRDDVRMEVTNNNPQPVQLTFTTFNWSNYYGNGVNYFRFGGNQYYNGNDYTSPTTASSSIWLPSGTTYTWLTDFTGYDYPMYGPFTIDLLFDGRCPVDGSVSASTPTPSKTPIPTRTLIPSSTPTASNTPTKTATWPPTNTHTPTPEETEPPEPSATPTTGFEW